MNKILLVLSIIILTFSACRKDVNETMVITDIPDPIVLIETNIFGRIVDENENPIPFANVQVENELVVADADGRFEFTQTEVKKSGNILQANASGYFKGISHSNFSADGSSFVEIRMIAKGNPTSINGANGGDISLANGLNISIPTNSIVTSDNIPYTGSANVYAKWLDPTDEEVAGVMPGALTGKDAEENPLALATLGMMVLDLETDLGDPLELVDGVSADIEMPIPVELQDQAPDEIPLWYFDLEEEQWVQYGNCKKVGNVYIGVINSSGYWNCGAPLPSICLSGTVYNNDSTSSAYLKVIVEDLTNNFIYWGYTDVNGFFCGSVPQAVPLRITIKDLCDNIVYAEEIGPFSVDTLLDDILLDVFVETYVINLKGLVSHCLTADVPNGHVSVRFPGKLSIYPFVEGGFDINLAMNCIDFPGLEISVFSASQQEISEKIIHNQIGDLDLDQLILCESRQDYFDINVDGFDYWSMPTKWYLKDNATTNHYVLEGLSGGGKFTLDLIDYQGVGTYPESVIFETENDFMFGPMYPEVNSASPNITVQITSDDGEYIEGTFAGTTISQSGVSLPITADFKIRKEP